MMLPSSCCAGALIHRSRSGEQHPWTVRVLAHGPEQQERQAQERADRLAQAIREALPEWSLAEAVTALQ